MERHRCEAYQDAREEEQTDIYTLQDAWPNELCEVTSDSRYTNMLTGTISL